MVYSRAATLSSGNTCSNVPLHCPICPPGVNGQPYTFWKYNIVAHMSAFHASDHNEMPRCPPSLLIQGHIFEEEDRKNGIPIEDTKKWREKET